MVDLEARARAGGLELRDRVLDGVVPLEGDGVRSTYVWSAAISELSMDYFIILWELRNQEVHGVPRAIVCDRNYLNSTPVYIYVF